MINTQTDPDVYWRFAARKVKYMFNKAAVSEDLMKYCYAQVKYRPYLATYYFLDLIKISS